jgi:hypothetical protein
MKQESIDPKARVWAVTIGADGKLRAELDARLLARHYARTVRLAA